MAEPSKAKVSNSPGHFYYDWALSKYRWTPGAGNAKANPLQMKKAGLLKNEVGGNVS